MYVSREVYGARGRAERQVLDRYWLADGESKSKCETHREPAAAMSSA